MFDRIAEGRWWDRAWSLVEGCTPCSPGCDHCWLRAMERRFPAMGQTRIKPGASLADQSRVTFRADRLGVPLRRRKSTAYAVWSDLFHEEVRGDEDHPWAPQSAAYLNMRRCPQHTFLVLTKRVHRMLGFFEEVYPGDVFEPPPNVWLGVTVCNQVEADEKIPLLFQVPAAVRFLSLEPLLGPIVLADAVPDWWESAHQPLWVIAGGETGPGARPSHPDWFRSVREHCSAAGVPYFLKGLGEWVPSDEVPSQLAHLNAPRTPGKGPCRGRSAVVGGQLMVRVGRKNTDRLLDGRAWSELPEAPHA